MDTDTVISCLSSLYESCTGRAPLSVVPLSSSGSHRRYFRIAGPQGTVIGVAGTDSSENLAFFMIDRHFASKGIAVPRILAISRDSMYYLQEDLGTESLFDRIGPGRQVGKYSEEEIGLLEQTVKVLPKIQIEGAEGLDFSKCYPKESFDRMSVMFDFHYFKYCFLKNSGLDFNEVALERDFEEFAEILLSCKDYGFMYRDFQSRNVMIKDGKPYFIDFQDGRRGPIYYDLASFVWQARSAFSPEVKRRLVDAYLDELAVYKDISMLEFLEQLRRFVLFRTLQVLGAYGFRGWMERKQHFLESIPYAIRNLRELLSGSSDPLFSDLPPLSQTLGGCSYLLTTLLRMSELPALAGEIISGGGDGAGADRAAAAGVASGVAGAGVAAAGVADGSAGSSEEAELELEIISFSYKKGLPVDESGNGGGYVFDCRAIHNPGKYEQYKYLTGMDAEVKFFLEKTTELKPFMESVSALVEAHVAKWLRRGFTHLMVGFGCTGGQHRSVYCAEALAARFAGRPRIKVKIVHRERGISKIL